MRTTGLDSRAVVTNCLRKRNRRSACRSDFVLLDSLRNETFQLPGHNPGSLFTKAFNKTLYPQAVINAYSTAQQYSPQSQPGRLTSTRASTSSQDRNAIGSASIWAIRRSNSWFCSSVNSGGGGSGKLSQISEMSWSRSEGLRRSMPSETSKDDMRWHQIKQVRRLRSF